MTYERYRELLNYGPTITEEDAKRLGSFLPKPLTMALAVRFALYGWRHAQ